MLFQFEYRVDQVFDVVILDKVEFTDREDFLKSKADFGQFVKGLYALHLFEYIVKAKILEVYYS